MVIDRLKINHFRNLTNVDITLANQFNLFIGKNGSGKTSLLESIYYLSRNRSFRSRHNQRVIQYNKDQFTLFAELESNRIGLQRLIDGDSIIKINGETIATASELAKYFPLISINADTFHLLDGGPDYRRQFLDWGAFHVEQQFIILWRQYQRLLKQRNSALRNKIGRNELIVWDSELSKYAKLIDAIRKDYFSLLTEKLQQTLKLFLPNFEIDLSYYQGWRKDLDLTDALSMNLEKDYDLGYSSVGPHRADIKVKINSIPAKEVLSRGQQKLFVIALCLAQGKIYQEKQNNAAIYLIDDFTAEIDHQNQEILLKELKQMNGQAFITLLDDTIFNENGVDGIKFHVEQGNINRID